MAETLNRLLVLEFKPEGSQLFADTAVGELSVC